MQDLKLFLFFWFISRYLLSLLGYNSNSCKSSSGYDDGRGGGLAGVSLLAMRVWMFRRGTADLHLAHSGSRSCRD